jgi:hypothetical protein
MERSGIELGHGVNREIGSLFLLFLAFKVEIKCTFLLCITYFSFKSVPSKKCTFPYFYNVSLDYITGANNIKKEYPDN